MKLLRSLSAVAAAVVLLAGAAFAADLSGTWKWTTEGRDGQKRESTLKVEQKDGALTGTISGFRGENAISEGKVDGDNVTFSVERAGREGQKWTQKFTGKLEGETLKLSTEQPAMGDRPARKVEYSATRAK